SAIACDYSARNLLRRVRDRDYSSADQIGHVNSAGLLVYQHRSRVIQAVSRGIQAAGMMVGEPPGVSNRSRSPDDSNGGRVKSDACWSTKKCVSPPSLN